MLFYRGSDNGLKMRRAHPDGTVSDEVPFAQGQSLTSDITAVLVPGVVPGADMLTIFYRGSDSGLYTRWLNQNAAWSEEQSLGES